MPMETYVMGREAKVAERYLEMALGEVRDGIDAIPSVSAALAALRIEAGELAADELGDLEQALEGDEE